MSKAWRSSAIWPSHSSPIVRASRPGDLGAERGGDLRGPGQQEVAGQDGPEVPPPGVDALDGAAGDGLVHDVVVVQRAEVDQLAGHAAEHDVVGGGGAGAGGGDGHHRAQPLAAGHDQVAGDLGQLLVGGLDRLA